MAVTARTLFTLVPALYFVHFAAHPAQAIDNYVVDDGAAESFVGAGEPPFGLAALNHFVAQPGENTIVSISIAWGQVPDGTPATVLLYGDPNNDGNPIDGQLITGNLVATTNAGGNAFTTYAINPHTFNPGDSFFVGFWLQMPVGGWHPASLDTTSPQFESWLVISHQNFWITDLELNLLPPTPVDDAGLPAGNWMIRADAVPGPSMWIALVVGGIASRTRRRKCV